MAADDDGSGDLTDIIGLAKAAEHLGPVAEKLIDAVSGGLGKLYEPAAILLEGTAAGALKRREVKVNIKAIRELDPFKDMDPAVIETMKVRLLGTEYRRQRNILAIEKRAVEIASRTAAKKAYDVDPDFFAEWQDAAKDVSDAQLQDVFARILAAAPTSEAGRVPKPILDFLRQLDKDLASNLTSLYHRSQYTSGTMPRQGWATNVSPFARELGFLDNGQASALATPGEWITFFARDQSFATCALAYRAQKLCELVLSPRPDDVVLKEFAGRLPDFIDALARSPLIGGYAGGGGMGILTGIKDNSGDTSFFLTETAMGTTVVRRNPLFDETRKAVAELDLVGLPHARPLRSSLRKMVSQGTILFHKRVAPRDIDRYVKQPLLL